SFSTGGGSLEDDFTVTQGWISKDEKFTDDLDLVSYKLPGQPPTSAFLSQVKYDGIATGSGYYRVKPDQNQSGSTQQNNGDIPVTDGVFMYLTQFATYPPSPQVSASFSGSGTSFTFSGTYHADSTYDVTPSGQKNAQYNALVSISISPYKVPTGVTASQDNLPKAYRLYSNYPNPFNPSTMISYDIPSAGNVKLVVYDMLGRKVETLVNQKQSAGKYGVRFDASRLASGVYFYQLQAGSFVATRKLILLK
ncbi:MAG TPA: T9SS type A sorting domain-containing protein, partial [Bacteroidota bacterium]